MRSFTLALVIGACGSPHAIPDGALGSDATPDVAPVAITGRDILRVARCTDATRVPSVEEMPWSSLALSVVSPDGTAQPVTAAADGNFAFTVPGTPYDLVVTEDTNGPVTFAGMTTMR